MSKLGMVRVKGTLCRTRRGKFTRCKRPIAKGKGKGFAKKHTRGTKGRCVKWSRGKTRCVKRAHKALGYKRKGSVRKSSGRKVSASAKGRCLKWSKGRTRCIKRARTITHNADGSASVR